LVGRRQDCAGSAGAAQRGSWLLLGFYNTIPKYGWVTNANSVFIHSSIKRRGIHLSHAKYG
jgi:hypothetical protein